ncbi:hypothetical protein M1373_00310 [Candidatus Marsarchaeota archaeon]|nr:hypothetical protein [Candidatus Marsarchaeota archaeon]MCL5404492.1 hypothetical protein [Candidatus Marsarchaeota archaeon]
MGISKNKEYKNNEDAKAQASVQSKLQPQEETNKHLLRATEANASENQTKRNSIDKPAAKERTKAKKIATIAASAAALIMLGIVPFNAVAVPAGVLGTGAALATDIGLFAVAAAAAFVAYGALVYEKLSKKSGQKKEPQA